MITPSVFLLNVRTSAWLIAERNRWIMRANSLVGQDKKDALDYVSQVNAELSQRSTEAASGKSWFSRVLGNVAESLGGTGGAGASGLVGGVTDTVSDTASSAIESVGGFLKRFQWIILITVIILGGLFVYLKFGKK